MGAVRPRTKARFSDRHAVVGEIRYDEHEPPGTLIYVKSALTRQDPEDLHGYRSSHPTFPHETTVDQFFDEGQFESYRMLGYRSGLAAADEFEAGEVV